MPIRKPLRTRDLLKFHFIFCDCVVRTYVHNLIRLKDMARITSLPFEQLLSDSQSLFFRMHMLFNAIQLMFSLEKRIHGNVMRCNEM